MRHYELLFVLKPTLTEEEVAQKVDFLKEVLSKNEANLIATLDMGMRKLAYSVKKYERGTYTVFYFEAPSAAIQEIERIVRITEEIIKFMTVKYETKKELAHFEKLVEATKNKVESKKPQSTKENATENNEKITEAPESAE